MIVVADTTPLQYLILVQYAHVLPALYGRVVVPPAVVFELSREATPRQVRDWLAERPAWLEVRHPKSVTRSKMALGLGELEAIGLAEELKADSDDGLVDPRVAVERLRRTNFRADEELFQWLLTREKPASDL